MSARGRIYRSARALIGLLTLLLLASGQPAAPAAEAPQNLKVVTKSLPPFVIIEGDTAHGFSIDLLDKLAARMGFTYELEIVDSVAEQLAKVKDGSVDLAIAGISITSERERTVEFSHPMFRSGLQIMTKRVQRSGSAVGASLTRTVWPLLWKLLLMLFVVAHVVWLVRRKRDPDFPDSYFKGLGEGLWFAAESLATVGYGDKSPAKWWGRLAAVMWMFVAIFVVANLTGSISADLVGQQLEGAIDGPDDLPGKKVATVAVTTSAEYLKGIDLELLETRTIEEAIRQLRDGRVDAVVMDSPVLRYYASEPGSGQVEVVGPLFSPQDYGIAFPPGSPLRKAVNEALLQLMEDGTYSRLERSWFGE